MKIGKSRLVICVWFMFVCGSCSYRFVEQNNCLKVSSPEYLKDTYECAMGNFGTPQHEGTLSGSVVYPKANQRACNSFNNRQLSFKTDTLGSLPVLLLVDRGDCYFILKVWNAQNAGAAGVLIADNRPKFLNTLYWSQEIEPAYQKNITIPFALISRSIGELMKKTLYNGGFVSLNLEWSTKDNESKNSDDE